MIYLYPYRNGSGSVRNLREQVEDLRIIRREGSRFRGNPNKLVINWGCSNLPEEVMEATVINRPEAVDIAADKLKFFSAVEGLVNVPDWTVNYNEASEWIKEGHTVLAREKLRGNSGEGINVLENLVEFDEFDHSDTKIYVKYVPKKDEYRIHVSNGEVIDMQRKAIRRDTPANMVNWKVRNHDNGFIFVREGVEPPDQVIEQSKLAVKACGLDFGAVDVIWNNHREKAYVLEVNTAPGLEGTTLETYKEKVVKKVQWQELFEAARRVGGNPIRGQNAVIYDELLDIEVEL